MNDKRRALGRGLGALIPGGPAGLGGARPVDVFFHERPSEASSGPAETAQGGSATSARVQAEDQGTAAWDRDRDRDSQPGWPRSEAEPERELVPVTGARFEQVPVHAVRPNPRQPRTVFDEDDLAELTHSISEIGVLQPVVVREIDQAQDPSEAQYELVMGERRWRAAIRAGLDTVPAIVRETADDVLLRDALLENLHRSELNPLEEAAAYQQLLDDFGGTHDELASRLGRSRPQISNTIRLLRLPPLVARRVAAGVLSAGHARALLALPDGAAIERLAQRIVAEGLSVRAVEELVTLDARPAAARRDRTAREDDAALLDLAATLSDRLDTRVRIAMGQRKGRLSVEFASVEDLHRILGLLVDDEAAAGVALSPVDQPAEPTAP